MILTRAHEISGHGSPNTMKFLLLKKYKWKGIVTDIDNFVEKCKLCTLTGYKRKNTKNKAIRCTEKDELWVVDLIGRIQCKSGKNKFILVCIDHYTKWVMTRVINNKSAACIIGALLSIFKEIKTKPNRILSDNGREFLNTTVQNRMKKLLINWDFNSPYHHETVGAAERCNQTLWNKIRVISKFGKKSWECSVKKATHAMNISFNRSIGTSPYMARYEKNPLLFEEDYDQHETLTNENVHNKIKKHKEQYYKEIEKGKFIVKRDIPVGSKVLVYNHQPRKPLAESWIPGYTITQLIGQDAYEINNGKKKLRLNKEYVKLDTT